MKRGREKLLSHVLMVVAPLLVLLMITVAWFVNAQTIGVSELSFAAQNSGPGAVLYPYETLGKRTYDRTGTPPTLTYDEIVWGERRADEKADITVENMRPGQCEYYLLVSDNAFTPKLMDVTLTDGDGNKVTDEAEVEKLLMAQCVGLYLLPTALTLGTDPTGWTDTNVSIPLARNVDSGKLEAAVFKNGAAGAVLTPPTPLKTAYILAVYCDSTYGQNGIGGKDVHTGTLPGTISFSLAFDTAGGT